MASTFSGVRLVRCPKCNKILPELPNIPLYRCGACGTKLRAKIHTANRQNVTIGSVEVQENFDNSPLIHEFSSAEKELNGLSSELDDGVKQEKSPNVYAFNLSSESTQKEESLEHGTDDNTSARSEIGIQKAADQLNSKSRQQKVYTQEYNGWNSQEDESPDFSQQGDMSMKQSNMTGDPQDSTISDFSSEKDVSCGTFCEEDTGDEDYSGSVPNGPKEVIEGTFVHKEAQDPLSSEENRAGEDDLTDKQMNSDAGRHLQSQELPAKPLCESDASASTGKSDSNIKAASFSSEDFHSVLTWLDPENAVLAEGSPNHQQGSQSTKLRSLQVLQEKILMKMDELRDELGELFDKSAEGKIRALSRLAKQRGPTKPNSNSHPPRTFQPRKNVSQKYRSIRGPRLEAASSTCLHCKANLCNNVGNLKACPSDSCHHIETRRPKIQMGCSHQPCCHEVQAHEAEQKKVHTQVKRQPPRHHCRPILGGAPFVICYKCLKLLQLPSDFIISRRRLHKLQCGSCSEILLFSYRARTHASPQTPSEVAHPPSTVENEANTNPTSWPEISTLPSTAQEDPISYSEEYGISYGRSYSTETEQQRPLYVSRNSSAFTDETNGRRLHRLMGYSSATELLYQRSDIDDFDSIEATSQQLYGQFEGTSMRDIKGKGICMIEHPAVQYSLHSMDMDEEEDSKRSRRRRAGAPVSGLVRKGLRELNQGLEILRLKST